MFNDNFFESLFNDKVELMHDPMLQLSSGPHSPNSYPCAISDCPSFGLDEEAALDGPSGFYTSSQDSSEAKSNELVRDMEDKKISKSKAKRKPKLEPNTAELRKQIRAEKNKKYAKESRDRKRKYVEELELQVETLKGEVEMYKAKLKEYELLEKYKKSVGFEFYETMAKVYQDLNTNGESIANNSAFTKSLKKAICEVLDEQQTVLDLLTKNIVETMLPLPTRISMWMAEHNVDITDSDKVAQAFMNVLKSEQIKTLVDYMKIADPAGNLRKENNLFVSYTSKKVKGALKDLIASHKKLKLQLNKIKKHVCKSDIPLYTPYIAEMVARIGTEIAAVPEIKNCGICQLLEGMTITKEDEGNKDDEGNN